MKCQNEGCNNSARWGLFKTTTECPTCGCDRECKVWVRVCDACEKEIGDVNLEKNGGLKRLPRR